MAEMLAFWVRLLVVRYLAFVVVQAVMRARGNAGTLCSTGAASSDLTVENILHVGRSLGRAVLNDDAGAVRQSKAMNVDEPPVFVAVARRLSISAQIVFFQRKEGVGLGKGARA